LETVRAAVSSAIGHAPPQRIQVIVDDPFAQPNGSAWPLLDSPAMILWATPPSPRDDIGHFADWRQVLGVHEYAHLAHLLRPSRNARWNLLWNALPVQAGPIAMNSPRWVIEGYATHIEGLITQSGRPNGVWRPAILRQWALEGQLPPYAALDHGSGYIGGEFMYLGGSAFLDWLVARQGDSSLVHLWRRMTARTVRGFEPAFSGVFGEPAPALYGRFTAELTEHAMAMRRRIVAAESDTGAIVQRLMRETGDPAISLDGGRVAVVLRPPNRAPRVVIWATSRTRPVLRTGKVALRISP
jgi:hypothetical protein